MRFFYRFFVSKQQYTKKITELENKVAELEARIKSAMHAAGEMKHPVPSLEKDNQPMIQIEQLTVQKIIIQQLDYANNFGQLGIKELTGKLMIGTAYEGDFSKEIEAKVKEKLAPKAKVNMRGKQEP